MVLLFLTGTSGYAQEANLIGKWKGVAVCAEKGAWNLNKIHLDFSREGDSSIKGYLLMQKDGINSDELRPEENKLIAESIAFENGKIFIRFRGKDNSVIVASLQIEDNRIKGEFYSMGAEDELVVEVITAQKE